MGIIESEIIPSKVFIVSSHSIFMSTTKYLTLKKAVNGTLFALALLMAAARMVVRVHSQRKLHPDDFVLMFACLTFIPSQVLLYILKIDNIQSFGAVTFDLSPQTPALTNDLPETYYRQISKILRIEYSIGILTWTSIFGVKICFLLFFPSDDYTASEIDYGLESNTWDHNNILGSLLLCIFHQLSPLWQSCW